MSIQLPLNEPLFPIRTAAKLLNISVHTLRMYEKEGLIIPFKKKSSHRLYSKADLDRLECIRSAINKGKISIAGIKTLYSLIPCWKIKNCTENNLTCKAFNEHFEPCWNIKPKKRKCTRNDCRECEIYTNFATCTQIKTKLEELLPVN